MSEQPGPRGYRFFEWVNRRIGRIAAAVLVLAVVLVLVGELIGSDEDPDFAPSGAIYDTQDRVDEVFGATTAIQEATFLVEDPQGVDVLTRDALLEWKRNSDKLRANPESQKHLRSVFNNDLGVEVDGIFSLADAVDEQVGGLEGATDIDVKAALDELLADDAPTSALRFTLSERATRDPGIERGYFFREVPLWLAPAFTAPVVYDLESFPIDYEGSNQDIIDLERRKEAERWLRDVQDILRGDERNFEAIGIAIDFELTFEEQANATGPYIFLAVALILLLAGGLLRSYWAAVLVGAGLAVIMMIYTGLVALMGLKGGSLLTSIIVPFAMISFGVDFFIHGSGRSREKQVEGFSRERAYALGMTAVFTALVLAAASSAAAFLSNAASGIEAITEFGIAAAVALGLAYAILGLLVPKIQLAIEDSVGPAPADRELMLPERLGFLVTAAVAGVVVSVAVLMPLMGAAGLAVFILLFILLPYRLTKRRNARARAKGRPVADEVKGAGHGFKAAGAAVHFLARWRVVTVPVVIVLAGLGLFGATQVDSEFALTDFLAQDTDPIVSLERLEEHFVARTSGPGYIYVEGDLTQPATLAAMQKAVDDVDGSGAELQRDFDGSLVVAPNAVSLVREATASSVAAEEIAAETGVQLSDDDGDGLADTSEQVTAIYSHALESGIRNDEGATVFAPDIVPTVLYADGGVYGTRLEVGIPSGGGGALADETMVQEAQAALDGAAENLRATADGVQLIGVSGEPITLQDTLDSFTRSMLVSLPISIVLATLIAALIMRSLKYGLISVVPILAVVAWVYAFMYLADYEINPVTATIAAVAVGVGIDYSTHFTTRFREEFVGEPSRFPALRRAGEGTGGALAISALTSMLGFLVLAAAPMPIFSAFGVLTAVMIVFSLLMALLVLPSLLLLVTPSRKGEERRRLEEEITKGEVAYEPHARETALRRPREEEEPTA